MDKIKFSKLHGQGNDFIVINALSEQNLKPLFKKDEIKKICHRNFGVGADGLIFVKKSSVADFKMDYFNRDGSAAEMCGNGIRCMAKFIFEKNLSKKTQLNIETLAGIKEIFINLKNNKIESIRVDMGRPEFSPKKIPVRENRLSEILNYKLEIDSKFFYINCVSMGNPHCVIFLDKKNNLNNIPFKKWGILLENHPFFPNKTNVEFVKLDNINQLSMRVWERGVGETLACGTGACAAGVCALRLNKISSGKVKINLPGGELSVILTDKKSNIFLEGKVMHIFDGQYFI